MSVNTPFSGGRSRDQSLSYQDFMNLRKQQLKQRCLTYGLKSHGTKEALATRLVSHFRRGNRSSEGENPVPGPSQPHLSEDDDDSASNIISGNPAANVPMDELRVLIREEISQATQQRRMNTAPQSAAATQALSPASSIRNDVQPGANLVGPSVPTSSTNASNQPNSFMQAEPGNTTILLPTPRGCLPPLSMKIIKAIQSQNYVDFNELLPNALYDSSNSLNQFTLTFRSDEGTDKSVALTSPGGSRQKVNNISSWFEAWNIYIQAMIKFHPNLAADLMSYQESICTFQRLYPVSAWLKYDAAFRMSMGLNKQLSWTRTDDYCFNKFIRCAYNSAPQPQQPDPKGFRGSSSEHSASQGAQADAQQSRSNFRRFRGSDSQQQGVCFHYNTGRCFRYQCKFAHRCKLCAGSHPASMCNTR